MVVTLDLDPVPDGGDSHGDDAGGRPGTSSSRGGLPHWQQGTTAAAAWPPRLPPPAAFAASAAVVGHRRSESLGSPSTTSRSTSGGVEDPQEVNHGSTGVGRGGGGALWHHKRTDSLGSFNSSKRCLVSGSGLRPSLALLKDKKYSIHSFKVTKAVRRMRTSSLALVSVGFLFTTITLLLATTSVEHRPTSAAIRNLVVQTQDGLNTFLKAASDDLGSGRSDHQGDPANSVALPNGFAGRDIDDGRLIKVDPVYLTALGLPVGPYDLLLGQGAAVASLGDEAIKPLYPDTSLMDPGGGQKPPVLPEGPLDGAANPAVTMEPLGATEAQLWPNSAWQKAGNGSEPVIVSAVTSGRAGDAVHFLRNALLFLPNATVILFDLGLSSHELELVKQYCNHSSSSSSDSNGNNKSVVSTYPDSETVYSSSRGLFGRYHHPKQVRVPGQGVSSADHHPLHFGPDLNNEDDDPVEKGPAAVSSSTTTTTSACEIRKFDEGQIFPRHVAQTSNSAFRPLAIQSVLKDAGCVLWMDIDQRFTVRNLTKYLRFAQDHGGVVAWPMEESTPTTSLTHPNMFRRLLWGLILKPALDASSKPARDTEGSAGRGAPIDSGAGAGVLIPPSSVQGLDSLDQQLDLSDYNFQHMVGMKVLLLYNTEKVRDSLMIPWVKCALTADCIEPIGAQATGCRFDKKPRYRYSGCHAYDTSALNIVLGQMFAFDESRYILPLRERFFVTITDEEAESDLEVYWTINARGRRRSSHLAPKNFGGSSRGEFMDRGLGLWKLQTDDDSSNLKTAEDAVTDL